MRRFTAVQILEMGLYTSLATIENDYQYRVYLLIIRLILEGHSIYLLRNTLKILHRTL